MGLFSVRISCVVVGIVLIHVAWRVFCFPICLYDEHVLYGQHLSILSRSVYLAKLLDILAIGSDLIWPVSTSVSVDDRMRVGKEQESGQDLRGQLGS